MSEPSASAFSPAVRSLTRVCASAAWSESASVSTFTGCAVAIVIIQFRSAWSTCAVMVKESGSSRSASAPGTPKPIRKLCAPSVSTVPLSTVTLVTSSDSGINVTARKGDSAR